MRKDSDILDSLDGIRRATPQPWFYTRLKARLENLGEKSASAPRPLVARPVFVLAGLFLVLLINLFILVGQGSDPGTSVAEQNEQSLSETELYTGNSYDIESYVQQ